MRNIQVALTVVVLGLLAGCGGGGGGGAAPAPVVQPSSAEGVYQGTTSNGWSFDAIVLDDSSVWAIYGNSVNSGLAVTGVFTGAGSANSGTYTATTADFLSPGSTRVNGNLNANYVQGVSFNGSLTEGNTTISVSAAAPVTSLYNYNTPAAQAAVSGTWNGSLLDGETATISVGSNGGLTGTSSLGCTFTGSVTPRPGGKNVFNVSVTFGSSPCAAANQTATGIALVYPIANGLTQIVAGLVTASGAEGSAFFAQR